MSSMFRVEILMICSYEPPEIVGRYPSRAEAVTALKTTLAKYMNDDDHLNWSYSIPMKIDEKPDQCDIYNEVGEPSSDIFGRIIKEASQ